MGGLTLLYGLLQSLKHLCSGHHHGEWDFPVGILNALP